MPNAYRFPGQNSRMSTSTQAFAASASPNPAPLPLSALKPGARGVITAIAASNAPATSDDVAAASTASTASTAAPSTAAGSPQAAPRLLRRLQDLGMVPGRTVTVLRRAPLGDPTVFQVADYELCLRKRDAALIQVTPLTDAEAAAGTGRTESAARTARPEETCR